MEPLNLKVHEPNDCEGKYMSINGAEYVIGPTVGRGAEKIAYKLFNRRSALCVHVIKFWRDELMARFAFGKGDLANVIARMRRDPELRAAIPISLYLEGHGGFFELQDFVNGYEYAKETPATKELMRKAMTMLENRDYETAKSLYAQILSENRSHTVALHNLAAAHANLGDYNQASQIERVAVSIEPNSILYQIAQIQYAGSGGNLRLALSLFGFLKSSFPYIHDEDDYAIRVYLMCGSPAEARQVWAEGMLSDQRLAELNKEILDAESAKARARPMINAALNLLESGDATDPNILQLLQEARATYDKDPYVGINLGLALARAGNFKDSIPPMLSAMSIVPEDMVKYCYANAAFNMIRMSEFGHGLMLLNATMDMMTLVGQGVIDLNDLPGVAVWISEETVREERIQSAARLVDYAIQNCPAKEAITDNVRKLAALYRSAAAAL